MINFPIIMEKAVCTSRLITLQDQKIKSNNNHFSCVEHLINIWVYFCFNILTGSIDTVPRKSDVSFLFEYRSLYAQTYSFLSIGTMLISLFRVTSWFETVCNIVTHWVNFRANHLHEQELQFVLNNTVSKKPSYYSLDKDH